MVMAFPGMDEYKTKSKYGVEVSNWFAISWAIDIGMMMIITTHLSSWSKGCGTK